MIPRRPRHRFDGRCLPALLLVLTALGCRPVPAPPPPAPPLGIEAIRAALDAADRYLNTNELDKAALVLDRLIERAPEEGSAHELMGQVLSRQAVEAARAGHGARARTLQIAAADAYGIAVGLDPESAGLHHSAGVVALQAGRVDAALEHFVTAGALAPNAPQFPLFAAQIRIQRQDWPAARADLERVLELDPDEALALASLAIVDLAQARPDDARQRIAAARALDPDRVDLRLMEVRVLRESGDAAGAMARLTALRPADRESAGALAERARCEMATGQPFLAGATWRRAYQASPADGGAYMRLVESGRAFLVAERPDLAASSLEAARTVAPDMPEVAELAAAVAEAR